MCNVDSLLVNIAHSMSACAVPAKDSTYKDSTYYTQWYT